MAHMAYQHPSCSLIAVCISTAHECVSFARLYKAAFFNDNVSAWNRHLSAALMYLVSSLS